MSFEDTYSPARFDVRALNVTKIDRLIDCDIGIGECEFALKQIDRQMSDRRYSADRDWQIDANRAKEAIVHKRDMLRQKRAALHEASASQREFERFAAANKPTLRDQMAMSAMSLLIRVEDDAGPFAHVTDVKRAERAYQLADAMLAERAK